MEKPRPKVGLALGAGGGRGFCHVGVLQAFIEHGIPIDCVTGSSMGALIGGAYCAGMTIDTMKIIARVTRQSFVMDVRLLHMHKRKGIFEGTRIKKLLLRHFGEKLMTECDIPIAVTAVDLASGELVVFKEGVLWERVRASISIPIFFEPVEIDGRVYIDGGVLKRIPVDTAREMGADFVIAVDAVGPLRKGEETKSILQMITRYADIVDWAVNKDDAVDADVTITPDLGNRSNFVFKDNKAIIDAGYEAALAVIPEIKEKIRIWEAEHPKPKAQTYSEKYTKK